MNGGAPSTAGSFDFIVEINEINYEGSENGTLILLAPLGIDEANLKIYPNPFSSYLKVESIQPLIISIYDLNRKNLLTSPEKTIDVSELVDGVYVIKVESEDGSIRMKRMIKKTN